MTKKQYIVQARGQVTIPIEFRRQYNLKKGDGVAWEETEIGWVVRPISKTTKIDKGLAQGEDGGLCQSSLTLHEATQLILRVVYKERCTTPTS